MGMLFAKQRAHRHRVQDAEELKQLIRDRSKTKCAYEEEAVYAMIVPDDAGYHLGLVPVLDGHPVNPDPHCPHGGHFFFDIHDVLYSRSQGDTLCIVEPAPGAFETFARICDGRVVRYKTSCVNVFKILSLKDPDTLRHLKENEGVDVRMANDLIFRYAVANGHLKVVEYMVEHEGVDPTYITEHGKDIYNYHRCSSSFWSRVRWWWRRRVLPMCAEEEVRR